MSMTGAHKPPYSLLNRLSTYYISGPMSGHPEHNYPTFINIEQKLSAHGLNVISPHLNGASLSKEEHEKLSWPHFMRLALHQLIECDSIIMLPWWETSRGACHELDIALDLQMPVYLWRTDETLISLTGG